MTPNIRVLAHPPERGRRATTLVAAGSCCCCCCCCVHSVGGLAGAVYGSLRRDAPDPGTLVTEEQIRLEAETAAAHGYAVKVYWLALTIVGALTIAVSLIVNPNEPLVGPALVLGFLPAGQLAAALISVVVIRMRPPVRKDLCLRRIGRITLLGFIGAVLGTGGTVLTFTMF